MITATEAKQIVKARKNEAYEKAVKYVDKCIRDHAGDGLSWFVWDYVWDMHKDELKQSDVNDILANLQMRGFEVRESFLSGSVTVLWWKTLWRFCEGVDIVSPFCYYVDSERDDAQTTGRAGSRGVWSLKKIDYF